VIPDVLKGEGEMVAAYLGVIRRNNYQKRRCGGVVCRCLVTQRYSKG